MQSSTHPLFTWLALCVALFGTSGCATYGDSLRQAHDAAASDGWPGATARLDTFLGVESPAEIPDPLDADQALAVLERAIVLQAQGEWEESRRDFLAGEAGIEQVDFERDPGGKVATWLYSGSSANYAAPPVERLSLNAFNLLNYLAQGKTREAAVEARRYQVMRDYLETTEAPPIGRFGAYLSGFVFEHLGEPERALRYYEEVLARGRLASLEAPVARLAARTPWRGPAVTSALERAKAHAGDVPAAPDPNAGRRIVQLPPRADSGSEILVVTSIGRTPVKVAKRIPIGAAIGIAGAYVTGDLDILRHSALKVLVFPELTSVPSRVTGATVRVDGVPVKPELVENLSSEVAADYERAKPALLGQALTRLIARAAVAEGANLGGRQAQGNALGTLLALGTEAALVALDKPDTRSWSFLPGKVLIARIPVAPGNHEVEVILEEGPRTHPQIRETVEVEKGSYAAVIVTEPR